MGDSNGLGFVSQEVSAVGSMMMEMRDLVDKV